MFRWLAGFGGAWGRGSAFRCSTQASSQLNPPGHDAMLLLELGEERDEVGQASGRATAWPLVDGLTVRVPVKRSRSSELTVQPVR